MPTTTIHSATSDGWIDSRGGADYPASRAGTGSPGLVLDDVTTPVHVGQRLFLGSYFVREAFFNFDVSEVAGAVVNSATLSFWLTNDTSTTDFVIECRARDWGDTLTTADWVPGADLSGLTLLASIDTNGIGATGAYKALTSEAALLTAIEAAAAGDGILRLMLCSKNTTDNTAPTGNEFVQFSSSEEASTTQDPKLDIDYTEEEESSSSSSPSSQSSLSSSSNSSSSSVIVGARQLTAASNQRFTRASEATFQATGTQYWQACWAYLNSNVSRQCLAKGSTLSSVAGTCEFGIRTAASSTWRLRWQNTSSADNVLASSVANAVGQWYFIFGWWDGTNQLVGISVNGTVNTVAHTTGVLNASNPFYIGGLSNGVDWDGRVARAALGKPPTALGNGTVGTLAHTIFSALFNEGIGLYWSEISGAQRTAWGLTAGNGVYYDMDETSGDAIEEVAGLNATAAGGPTGAPGPDAAEEQSPSSSSSSSSSVSSSSSSSSSSVQFSSSSSSSSSSPSSQSSASSPSSVEFSSSSSSSSTSSSSSSSSSPSSQSSLSSESSESSSFSSSSSSPSSQSSSSSSSPSSSSSSSLSSSSPSSSSGSSSSSLSSSSSIIKYGTGERIILVIP